MSAADRLAEIRHRIRRTERATGRPEGAVTLVAVSKTFPAEEIAEALAAEMRRQGRTPKLLVQVNTGLEPQKAGIDPRETAAFVERCRSQHGLTIAGLMCIPPAEDAPGPHFALLAKLGRELALPLLSMGMSSDFETAIGLGATHVRVGSAIFGHRDYGAPAETSAA